MKPKQDKVATALAQFINTVAPANMLTPMRPLRQEQQGVLRVTQGVAAGELGHNKGKRSRRRRAARMRARGLVHVDGKGWQEAE